MNASSPDPLHGLDPADLMAAAAMPTDDGADTLPITPLDLPTLEEITAAFPDLEVLSLIGHGGMSAVFKARQPRLDRTVALKVLPQSLAATPGFAERFTREGRVLARLSHPSIVAVHDFGESGGFCYLLMEYVDGVNLRQAMRAGRFTPEQALSIIPAICDALQFAHTQGVLHRDIKPENILLDSRGKVKIADFGIAKILDEKGGDAMLLTQSGARLGTAPYMAPEQIEQPSSVDHRADIYSLGVVFYEMLTGELPLGRFAAPSTLSSVGGNIDEIVFRALEKERSRRQQSVDEFKTQVEGAGNSLPNPRRRYRANEPFEYKSKRMLCGLPLLHIVHGRDPATGKVRTANGFFAFGDKARGVFAFGGMAHGVFAFGGLASGVFAFGGLACGLISVGGLALGLLFALGGLGIGSLAFGGMAVGFHAYGGVAVGWYAAGGQVIAYQGYGGDVIATHVVKNVQFMPPLTNWLASLTPNITLLSILGGVIWLPLSGLTWMVHYWAQMQKSIEMGEDAPESKAPTIFWLIPALTVLCAVFWWMIYRVYSVPGTSPTMHIIPVLVTSCGMVLFLAALPLWLRLVPMNPIYGLRIPSTMASDDRWYDANAHSGKKLFEWSLSVIVAGIAGFYQLPRHQDDYPWAALAFILVAIVAALVSTWWWLRHHPVSGPARKESHLAKVGGKTVIAVIVALFIKSFILQPYLIPAGNEPGVAKGSHWIASKLDNGFSTGNLVVYEHDNGQPWIARVERREPDGLVLKRGGKPETFFVNWRKVIGKMLFSHFTPDAPAAQKEAAVTRMHDRDAMKPTSVALNEPPQLLFLRLAPEGQPWSDELYDPEGRKVSLTPEIRSVLEETTNDISSDQAGDHWLQAWVLHPDFDEDSNVSARKLDEAGMPASSPLERETIFGQTGRLPGLGGQVHSVVFRIPALQKLPPNVQLLFNFSLGPWDLVEKVTKDPGSHISTNDWMLGGVGENAEKHSFVSWVRRRPERQIVCHAINASGKRITGLQSTSTTSDDISERAVFSLRLEEVAGFELCSRDIRQHTFQNVRLPPPQEAVVFIGDKKHPWKSSLTLGLLLEQQGMASIKLVRLHHQLRDGLVQINDSTRTIQLQPGDRVSLPE